MSDAKIVHGARRIGGGLLLALLLQIIHYQIPIVPSPLEVCRAFASLVRSADFWTNLLISVSRVITGLLFALIMAATLSFLSFTSAFYKGVIEGATGLLRPIPPITWIPITIAVFGLSEYASIFVISIGAFFPIFSSAIHALTFEGDSALRLATLIRGRLTRHFFTIVIPASLPTIFTGLTVAIGFAWMVVVVAEMIAVKSGLGYQIQIERQLLRLDYVVAYMAVIGLVGAFLNGLAERGRNLAMPYLRLAETVGTDPEPIAAPNTAAPVVDRGPAIRLDNIGFAYGSAAPVLRLISLSIAEGEIIALVGPSGCGKTTLLKLLAGELVPRCGRIDFSTELPVARVAAWVFQSGGLFDWMTAEENAAFGIPPDRQKEDYPLDAWLALTGIAPLARRYPASLSGGQRQRVQIARALTSRRELVLFDEPFSALDALTREKLIPAVRSVFKSAGRTCVFVTHDVRDAIRFSDRICVLQLEGASVTSLVTVNRNKDGISQDETDIASSMDAVWLALNASELPGYGR